MNTIHKNIIIQLQMNRKLFVSCLKSIYFYINYWLCRILLKKPLKVKLRWLGYPIVFKGILLFLNVLMVYIYTTYTENSRNYYCFLSIIMLFYDSMNYNIETLKYSLSEVKNVLVSFISLYNIFIIDITTIE